MQGNRSNQAVSPKEKRTLRILFVASEADPFIKVGGLGDVTGSLPHALRHLSPEDTEGYTLDVRLVIPFHSAIAKKVSDAAPIATFTVKRSGEKVEAQAFLTHDNGLPVYLIAGAPIEKDAPVYSLDTRKDGEKYTFFSLAVLELVRQLEWQPDVIHAHDWHTALTVYMLNLRRATDPFFQRTHSIFTVHNLPFMGAGIDDAMKAYGIPRLSEPRLPEWGEYQPLPMALATADIITTVSPAYGREILSAEFGCGLQNFLSSRSDSVVGVLNGLDEAAWDPSTDKGLHTPFNIATLPERIQNKQALMREFDLPPNLDLPLLILISRMDWQKGVDLALDALRELGGLPWQAILLGSGDPVLEANMHQLETEFPYRVRAVTRFDTQLSRRMYAGGDMLLMPSRYEPCGLAQMIAMRYGCIPVARATGGLRDTVKDTQSPETSTGFLFEDASPEALAAALRRAIAAYADPQSWRARQLFAMQQDFSWQRSARTYAKMYDKFQEPL